MMMAYEKFESARGNFGKFIHYSTLNSRHLYQETWKDLNKII